MLLKIFTPNDLIIKEKVYKITAESLFGSFGILPKHIDFVTKILPCILTYIDKKGEGYVAIDEGILVKQEDIVSISAKGATESRNLGKLTDTMRKKIDQSEEDEKGSTMEITKLEFGIVKSFYDLEKKS